MSLSCNRTALHATAQRHHRRAPEACAVNRTVAAIFLFQRVTRTNALSIGARAEPSSSSANE